MDWFTEDLIDRLWSRFKEIWAEGEPPPPPPSLSFEAVCDCLKRVTLELNQAYSTEDGGMISVGAGIEALNGGLSPLTLIMQSNTTVLRGLIVLGDHATIESFEADLRDRYGILKGTLFDMKKPFELSELGKTAELLKVPNTVRKPDKGLN